MHGYEKPVSNIDENKINTGNPLYYPDWPNDVEAFYRVEDPPLSVTNYLEYRTKYLRLISFLETCVDEWAIVYRRNPVRFEWVVVNEDQYDKVCKKFGFDEDDFSIYRRR